MPASLAPLLLFAFLAAAYAAYRLRRAQSRGDRALGGLAVLVTVASLALSAQAVAAAHTPIQPDTFHPMAVAHLSAIRVVETLPSPSK
jgi:hypothetical protein